MFKNVNENEKPSEQSIHLVKVRGTTNKLQHVPKLRYSVGWRATGRAVTPSSREMRPPGREMQIELVEDCWTSLPGSRALARSQWNEERRFGIGTLQILQGQCRSHFLQKSIFFPEKEYW